ncbi:MAG: class I SAM-dependent rRNA methyltransferase [Bacteroidales bacterium]|jgi:23S rRNA (cytosine1962-C5)-methyltransferase|nr:class I SAM-dependent rRNA methyltransferase [Bacteroidales bacterium]
MNSNTRIILKSGKDQSVMRRHPWIFSGAIKKMSGEPAEGDIVDVFDNKDNFLARGHYQPGTIAVRILTFRDEEINETFYRARVADAIEYRKRTGIFNLPSTSVFRLIHAEGDNLPGLIVDIYNNVAVMQAHSVGMYMQKELLADILMSSLDSRITAVYDKSSSSLPFKAGLDNKNGFIRGNETGNIVEEYGHKFHVDWEEGQKTGFFVDQRENRKLIEAYSGGCNVLNLFAYTGGFSVYALRNAKMVHTVDVSKKAVEMAEKNIKLNYGEDTRHESFALDAFRFMAETDGSYDLIVLDPPAFAKHQNVMHNALQGYKRLNMKAMEIINPGGILFTFSCSQVVNRENFRKSVFAGAANAGRKVRIIHQLSQPADHPVNIFHPESEYLKGLVLYIE